MPEVSWISPDYLIPEYGGPPRNVKYIDNLNFDAALRPKPYEQMGTHPESTILILDVEILDATGRPPYHGDVLIKGE